jgi:2-polyprenyl-6-methoxyphenol hydroxylase-like FAD-dependent oxidoreductase
MPHIVVVGGGIAGLATALMLTRQGHEITVLERDPEPVPDTSAQSWESWERTSVMQFRQPHLLHAGGWRIIEEQLPEVARAVRMAGGAPWNRLSWMPSGVTDRAPRPGDEKWDAVNARRPVLEHAFAAAAADGRMEVRRGVRVTGLLSDRPRHVSGVRIARGPNCGRTWSSTPPAAGPRCPAGWRTSAPDSPPRRLRSAGSPIIRASSAPRTASRRRPSMATSTWRSTPVRS